MLGVAGMGGGGSCPHWKPRTETRARPITAAEYYTAQRDRPLEAHSRLGPAVFAQERSAGQPLEYPSVGGASATDASPSADLEQNGSDYKLPPRLSSLNKYLAQGVRAPTLQRQNQGRSMNQGQGSGRRQSFNNSFSGTGGHYGDGYGASWLWPGAGAGAGNEPRRSLSPTPRTVMQESYTKRRTPTRSMRSKSTEPPRNGSQNWLHEPNSKPLGPNLRTMVPLSTLEPTWSRRPLQSAQTMTGCSWLR